jgi:outer membrane autotransporter protein
MRQLGVMQLDSFHQRQGDQSLLTENGDMPAAWGRVWGGHGVLSQGGEVSPRFSGSFTGTQVGHDLYADTNESGHRNHYGLFVGFARTSGNSKGFAEGVQNLGVGQLGVDAYSLGGYWSHIAPSGWYSDVVLMDSALTLKPVSRDGVAARTHGNAMIGSFEGGYPFALGHGMALEPQAQVIWQHLSLHDFNDGVSGVSFNTNDALVGRLGVRLTGSHASGSALWQPYVRLNLLRAVGGNDTTTFDDAETIATPSRQTIGQLDAGVTAKFSQQGSMYASVSYSANLGGEHLRTVAGNVGVRWTW